MYDVSYMWNLEKNDTDQLNYRAEIEIQRRTDVWMGRGGDELGGWD